MNRRQFLKYCTVLGASVTLGKTSADAKWLTSEKRNGFPPGMLLIDAHAHPDIFPCPPFCDSTLENIEKIGMNASGFAVVEDQYGFESLIGHLLGVIVSEDEGKIKIVRRHSDLPHFVHPPQSAPGAILAVEGATPLGTNLNAVDVLYDLGVRLITPMHNITNQFGYVMKYEQPPSDLPPLNGIGLSDIGGQLVERMMKLGIIVDVAHAYIATLRGIAEIARHYGVPIIDSHTSLTHRNNPYGTTRARTLKEMKMVAKTGGVVCTWPLSYENRATFIDWAEEILEISEEIGIDHVGLGTDGGGGLPELIEGYNSILDLPNLVEAMDEVGFKREEIAAYMGGNLFRVIKQCMR